MIRTLKLIIFDCDGTLVDSQHMIAEAMDTAFTEHGLEPPGRARVRRVIGLSLHDAVVQLEPALDANLLDDVVERYKTAFFAIRSRPNHREPLFDGARDTLDSLRDRDDVLIGMATGKSRRGVDVVLAREGLEGHFHTIQTADDAPSKPHPAMVLQAIAEMGVERCNIRLLWVTPVSTWRWPALPVRGRWV